MSELFEKSIRTLELPAVLEKLAAKAVSQAAKDRCLKLTPSTDVEEVLRLLDETDAAKERLGLHGSPSFSGVKDVSAALTRADHGGMLNTRELLDIAGVLTASRQALTPAHFANCATPMESVHIRGMEGNPEFWETIIEGKRHDFDMERLEAEIVGSAAAFAREKALDALVLECTDLSAFSAPIQRAINLPVYDINSLVEYAYYAVCRKDY